MFDSPSEMFPRGLRDIPFSKTQSQGPPYFHQVNEERNGFGGYQPQLQQKKIFGFEIFVDNDIIKEMVSEEEWFQSIVKAGNVESVKFNLDLNIPDLNGRNIQVYDKDMERKYQSCRALLGDIYQVFKKVKREPFSIIIFVPEGMVSLLIGTRGYQINKIMKQSHTTIVVNQPINRMTYRTVKIQGYHSDIARACRIIYQILEDKSSIAYSIQKQPSQLDYTKARVKTKFIITSSILNYFQFKKKHLIKKIQDETKCLIRFKDEGSTRHLKKDEELCVLLGKLQDVQAMLVMVLNLIQIFYDEDKKNFDYTFKMLIPSNYVTKLIGQKGYMIRDIIEKSGGAQIKINSDKQSEKDIRECVISINGTRQNKIDAACLILEQIQCFKNGGPILQSGKSINENLAQQFKNSLPIRQEDQDENNLEFYSEKPLKKQKINDQETLPYKIEEFNKFIKNLPNKPNTDNDNKEEEGLIEVEAEPNITTNFTPTNEDTFQRHSTPLATSLEKPIDKSISFSPNLQKGNEKKRQSCSRSQSVELKQEKQVVEVKLVVPRRLGKDQKQLKYIESLSHAQIAIKEQHIEGSSQMIIGIRGSMKNNSHCLKLLQKRIIRLAAQPSSTR